MANCIDNSYVIYYTNEDKGTIQIQKFELNRELLDIALIGKVRLEYGEVFNENILHLLEHFAAPAIPSTELPDTSKTYNSDPLRLQSLLSNPTPGQIWFNLTLNRPYVYGTDGVWRPFGSSNEVAGISGVLQVESNSSYVPIPASPDGVNFAINECVWTVSPFYIPSEIDYMNCGIGDDGKIQFEYRLEGQNEIQTVGFVNYQVVCMKKNINLGTIECNIGPEPSMTPTPTVTLSVTPTPTMTVTPEATPSPTLTVTPDPTPESTPTVTPTLTLSATASATPMATPTPTSTATATPTPTISLTPSLTPTLTLSPTITPSTAPNNGDVFAVGFRPLDVISSNDSMYVRKIDMNGAFVPTYTYTSEYETASWINQPSDSRKGTLYSDWYMQVAGNSLYSYGINLGIGVYPNSVTDIVDNDYIPMAVSAYDSSLFMYVSSVNQVDPDDIKMRIRAYAFNGYQVEPLLPSIVFSNEVSGDVFAIEDNLIVATGNVISGGGITSTNIHLLLNVSGNMSEIGTPINVAEELEAIAVLDKDNMAYITSDNKLHHIRYNGNDELVQVSTVDLTTLTHVPSEQVKSIQYDVRSKNLYLAYKTVSAYALAVISTDGLYTINTSYELTHSIVVDNKNSIDVFEDIVLVADNTSEVNRSMRTYKFTDSTFSPISVIDQIPNNVDVSQVSFIIPRLPRPSVTPTPTPSPSITPSKTPAVTPTKTPAVTPSPTVTPSKTPAVTPTKTPAVTPSPSITPSKTPAVTPTKTPTKTPAVTPSRSFVGSYAWVRVDGNANPEAGGCRVEDQTSTEVWDYIRSQPCNSGNVGEIMRGDWCDPGFPATIGYDEYQCTLL